MSNYSFHKQLDLYPTSVQRIDSLPPARDCRDPRGLNVIQFPRLPDTHRAVSNDLVRSALFSCVQDKNRKKNIEKHEVATVDGVRIQYSGEQLNQDDHDLFMQIIFFAGLGGEGAVKNDNDGSLYISFSCYAILTALGKSTAGAMYNKLKKDIERLLNAQVLIQNSKRKQDEEKKPTVQYRRLIEQADYIARTGKDGRWNVKISKEIPECLNLRGFTYINWEKRKRLRGDLSRWLQLYFCSHAEPYPVKVDTLRNLSGSAATLDKFRERLKGALSRLEENEDISKVEWDPKNDTVKVFRYSTMSPSQKKFVAARKAP